MPLIFAAPYVPPAPDTTWVGMQMKWTGWDGSEWDLTNAAEGAVMLPGVRGLSMPEITHYTTNYASVAGSRWRGHNVEAREAFWPLQIFCDTGSQDWVLRDRAFWRTLRPEKTGTWTVIHPSGEERYLDLRFVDDGQQAFSIDPVLVGWTTYGITLAADNPFWRGKEIRREWAAGQPVNFFSATPGGLTISPSTTLDTAQMPNPGDAPAYPKWEVIGPVTNGQVGVNGRNIVIPFSIASGEVLIIDTDPAEQSATLYSYTGNAELGTRVLTNPADRTMDLGASPDFAPIPADGVTDITSSLVGAGKIALVLTPLYLRAW